MRLSVWPVYSKSQGVQVNLSMLPVQKRIKKDVKPSVLPLLHTATKATPPPLTESAAQCFDRGGVIRLSENRRACNQHVGPRRNHLRCGAGVYAAVDRDVDRSMTDHFL